MATPATGRDIIQEILRNMREGLEPLQYSTLCPSVFRVYLHADDLARLRGIVPRIIEEARRALDEEVSHRNRESLAQKLRLATRPEAGTVEVPASGWNVQLLENTEDETAPGDIVVDSELALPPKPDYGTGALTKRIATSRLHGETRSSQKYEEAANVPADAYATIEYEDQRGRQVYSVTKDQTVIGRGGRDYWTDVTLNTLPDVSREHVRLRRDPATGKFFLKDLSRLGTTIDGKKIPSSIEYEGGEKRDKNLEVDLPVRAEIGLADVIVLKFQAR